MKKYFITGLVLLLPLVVTIGVIVFLVNLLTKPFIGVVSNLLSRYIVLNKKILFLTPEELILYGSKIIIIILLFLFTLFLGAIARGFLINFLTRIGDKILHRIPIVNTVYKTTQEIIKTLFISNKNSFKQVVMVPFPKDNTFVIGLVSREAPKACSEAIDEEMITILVPTTPNPTTGFLVLYKKKDLIYLKMKPEEAVKFIISCGVISPGNPPPEEEPPLPEPIT